MRPVRFTREPLTDELIGEMMPLLIKHWAEVAHFHDIPLEPDIPVYLAAEASGVVRAYTARTDRQHRQVVRDPGGGYGQMVTEQGVLVGYAIFFVRPNPHYRSSLQAAQDIVFLDPSIRGGNGYRFIAWCDEQLRAEGVQAVYHHVKAAHDFGPMLERQGYQLVDKIYAKRLDVPSVAKTPEYDRLCGVGGFDPSTWAGEDGR